MTDPIGDMLTRLRNAQNQKFETVEFPASRVKLDILKILKEEGYIKNFAVRKRKSFNVIKVFLKYTPEGQPSFEKMIRVSKPGRRIYIDSKSIPTIAGGAGLAVVSTSQGIMGSNEARTRRLGGELICKIW